MLGHYKMRRLGFEHLMVDPETKRGAPNNWDLSRVRTDPGVRHVGGERTGTIPFMAMDLLTPEYWGGIKPPLYRHDLEWLMWLLPWVFLQYNGSKLENSRLRHWVTGNYCTARSEKAKLLHPDLLGMCQPMNSWDLTGRH